MKRLPYFNRGLQLVIVLAAILTMCGCSNQAIYEGIRTNRLNDCIEQNPHALEDCEKQFGMSYEEYREKR